MRVLLAWAVVTGCHAATIIPRAPHAQPPANPAPDDPAPDSRLDVPHADVFVQRREGPDSIDDRLSDISAHMRECYMTALEYSTTFKYGESSQDHLTMTIETHPSGTSDVDVELPYVAQGLAACLVQSLIRGHLDAGRKAARIVLAVDASIWFTSR